MALLRKTKNPRVPVVAPVQDGSEFEAVSAAIELEAFQEDRQDEDWQDFLRKAKARGAELEAEGRDI
jgi:hypothetical protein